MRISSGIMFQKHTTREQPHHQQCAHKYMLLFLKIRRQCQQRLPNHPRVVQNPHQVLIRISYKHQMLSSVHKRSPELPLLPGSLHQFSSTFCRHRYHAQKRVVQLPTSSQVQDAFLAVLLCMGIAWSTVHCAQLVTTPECFP